MCVNGRNLVKCVQIFLCVINGSWNRVFNLNYVYRFLFMVSLYKNVVQRWRCTELCWLEFCKYFQNVWVGGDINVFWKAKLVLIISASGSGMITSHSLRNKSLILLNNVHVKFKSNKIPNHKSIRSMKWLPIYYLLLVCFCFFFKKCFIRRLVPYLNTLSYSM